MHKLHVRPGWGCRRACDIAIPFPLLQCCTPEVWHAAMDALQRWYEAGSADFPEGFAQLQDAQLLLAAEGQQLQLAPALAQRAQRALRSAREPATVSAWHEQVSSELRAAGVEHRIEFAPEVGCGGVASDRSMLHDAWHLAA